MIKCFLKIFGVVFIILAELAIGICVTCIALSFSFIAGIIALILSFSIFIATIATLANYYLS